MNKELACMYCQFPENFPPGEVFRHTHTQTRISESVRSLFEEILADATIRTELFAAVRSMSNYEATIALAYIKRLIKSGAKVTSAPAK